MYWGPDFPDPSDYLVFNPGESLGLRAGWAAGADPTVTGWPRSRGGRRHPATRAQPPTQAWQKAQNATGPVRARRPARAVRRHRDVDHAARAEPGLDG